VRCPSRGDDAVGPVDDAGVAVAVSREGVEEVLGRDHAPDAGVVPARLLQEQLAADSEVIATVPIRDESEVLQLPYRAVDRRARQVELVDERPFVLRPVFEGLQEVTALQ
jgi:hypothetical protein